MDGIISHGEQAEDGIEPDHGLIVIEQDVCVVPVLHFIEICQGFGRIGLDAQKHFEELNGMRSKCIKHDGAVIEKFKDIGLAAVGVIIGIDEGENDSAKNLQDESGVDPTFWNSGKTEKLPLLNDEKKNKGIRNGQ